MIRSAALAALARMDGPIDVGLRLRAAARPGDRDVQNRAIDVLITRERSRHHPAPVEVLKDEDEDARRAAVEVLNEIGDAQRR